MSEELGSNWRTLFRQFDNKPIAAASIGQVILHYYIFYLLIMINNVIMKVHHAVTSDGEEVAVKVQYPGIAESVDSDISNLGYYYIINNI